MNSIKQKLYLQDKSGKYTYVDDISFHPLAISIQPLTKGTSKVIIYQRGDIDSGALVESLVSEYGEIQQSFRSMHQSNERDAAEYEKLFGNLYTNPISEYCLLKDYHKNHCEWEKGY